MFLHVMTCARMCEAYIFACDDVRGQARRMFLHVVTCVRTCEAHVFAYDNACSCIHSVATPCVPLMCSH